MAVLKNPILLRSEANVDSVVYEYPLISSNQEVGM